MLINELESKKQIPSSQSQDWWAKEFMLAAMECGCEFLVCGGASARLERQIVEAGSQLGLEAHVQATPTGLIISCDAPEMKQPRTEIRRIGGSSMNLSRLRYADRLLAMLAEGSILPFQAVHRIRSKRFRADDVSWNQHLGLFTIGFAAGLLRYGNLQWALVSGAAALGIIEFVGRYRGRDGLSGIFLDFLSCLLALSLGTVVAHFTDIPAAAVAIGTIIYVVPGLLLTTAISELVDQNFLTGTIKMIKAGLTLLAMGLAYLLIDDLATLLGFDVEVTDPANSTMFSNSFATSLLGIVLIVWGFAEKFKVPRKFVLWTILVGSAGWMTFHFVSDQSMAVLASFLSSFVVGFSSYTLSRHYKVPSQLFSVPGILSLVPGLLALSTFQQARGDGPFGFTTSLMLNALLISLAIVFGLIAGRVRA